ncbi:MAG: sn-glycerol-3-phosphate import ATP-binding protein UgpC [Alphaproteobacteria bacterium]|nr:MAG: sn-glycerol-3-phosphate import ATP-binding protein UgpC [Alphaproteobacteria bacterium]
MAQVTLQSVEKRFGDTQVLHGISTDIPDGAFVVIVGPSGCGKSTLLRIVAGLETQSNGQILIDGRDVSALEPKDRDIAMVFQNYALYPHMTVRENMAYGLKIRGLPTDQISQRVARAADILQLGPYLDRKPRQLSGGQRQRVAMGRAIVREPKAFLFDEPLSNLDAKLRVQMRVEIKKLQRQLGITSLYVTHDQVEAMTLADRLICMNAGRADQIGSPLDLYTKPSTTFVAGFIGSPAMNLVSATVSDDGVDISFGVERLPLDPIWQESAGRPVIFGIRPEHLVATGDGPIQVSVDLVEALGADTLIYGQTQSGQTLTARLPGSSVVGIGDKIRLTALSGHQHLFDTDTGIRLPSKT